MVALQLVVYACLDWPVDNIVYFVSRPRGGCLYRVKIHLWMLTGISLVVCCCY